MKVVIVTLLVICAIGVKVESGLSRSTMKHVEALSKSEWG